VVPTVNVSSTIW